MNKSLVIIIGLAAVMRWSCLGLIEYKADEALTVLSLQEWVRDPHMIESGLISSTGVKNFPLFDYLLLPLAMISTEPEFLSAMIAMVNVIMVGWFYLATRREYGEKIALVGGLILAVAPYPVLYSRKIWAQDLVMLFAVPIYDLLLRKKAELWLGLLLMLQAQIHGSGIFFLIVLGTYLSLTKKINRRLMLGLVIGLVPAIPYFISNSFSRPQTQYQPDLAHILMPVKLLTTFSWQEIMGGVDFAQFATQSPAVGVGMLVNMLVVLGWIMGGWRMKKIAGLIVGLILVYMVAGVPARLHYYQVVLPWIVVLVSWGMVEWFAKQPLLLKPTLGLMVAGYVLFWGMFLRYLKQSQGVTGDYGIPYQFSVVKVNEAVQQYLDRDDIGKIRTWAYFDSGLSRETNGAMLHFNLARYFEIIGERELAKTELDRAIMLDNRFAQFEGGKKVNETDDSDNGQ